MPDDGALPSTPVYLTGFSAEKNYGTTRYLVGLLQPDAYLLSAKGRLFPVWLKSTIENHVQDGVTA